MKYISTLNGDSRQTIWAAEGGKCYMCSTIEKPWGLETMVFESNAEGNVEVWDHLYLSFELSSHSEHMQRFEKSLMPVAAKPKGWGNLPSLQLKVSGRYYHGWDMEELLSTAIREDDNQGWSITKAPVGFGFWDGKVTQNFTGDTLPCFDCVKVVGFAQRQTFSDANGGCAI